MANTFRKIYKKTGNSGSSSDYQLVGNIGVNGVELDIMKGASSSTDGQIGLVPKPLAGSSERYLSANGTFKSIDAVGDLSWLNTPTKKDLVAAVNDAYGVATTNKELIGNTDIGDIGNGTITGILDMLNNEITYKIKWKDVRFTTDPYGQYNFMSLMDDETSSLLAVHLDSGYGAFIVSGNNTRIFRVSQLPLEFASSVEVHGYILYANKVYQDR